VTDCSCLVCNLFTWEGTALQQHLPSSMLPNTAQLLPHFAQLRLHDLGIGAGEAGALGPDPSLLESCGCGPAAWEKTEVDLRTPPSGPSRPNQSVCVSRAPGIQRAADDRANRSLSFPALPWEPAPSASADGHWACAVGPRILMLTAPRIFSSSTLGVSQS
jgi:hypothetical protein